MHKPLSFFILFALFAVPQFFISTNARALSLPAAPSAGVATASTSPSLFLSQEESDRPAFLVIPSLGQANPIVPVGINSKNEMDVPSGTTNNVGWYKFGTLPGDIGSAVLDAHVFAAFSKLKDVSVGADVYVVMESGRLVHFVIEEATTYRLEDLSPETLFFQNDAARLHLITCAGSLKSDGSTYSHRLVLFAKLVP